MWFGVAESAGRVVGYADLQESDGRADVDARSLEPDAVRELIRASVDRVRSGRPVWGYASSNDEPTVDAYRAAGFEMIRHSFSMRIELDGEQPAPEWPDGVGVRPWREGDDPAFHAVLQESFAEHFGFEPRPYGEWLQALAARPETDRSMWYLALAGDEVAGFVECSWHSSGDRTFGWVDELGVRSQWRRHGLGLALLRHSFAQLGERGAMRVGLGVDAENATGAVRLYERAGMHAERRYDTWELTR
ncbi:MAG: GNAT family N-acetyltransferase [Actinobacteria bacterium]|nr:GNAT family N-acetyltransferase [Actinomycetota bacterium]